MLVHLMLSQIELVRSSCVAQLSLVLCKNLEGWDGGSLRAIQEGGDVCILRANSLYCKAKTNITLRSNYNPFKIK